MSNWKKKIKKRMKKYIFLLITLLFTSVSYARHPFYDDRYYHEVKLSVGDAYLYGLLRDLNGESIDKNGTLYCNVSIAYLYRPVEWFWVGGNFINYFGNSIHYNWREYDTEGNFSDFSKSKMKYCAVIAPEVRFSFLNRERGILYVSISGGIGWENGYNYYHYLDDYEKGSEEKYPQKITYLQITYFGFSINFGRNDNIFLGGELGLGFKGFFNFHGGY